ncbi:MAG: hypothetical protein EA357_04105 [Micavibrio sp.]|nr:MAG: hypothetical protein EA357_04105 [Micavibrio sp.]
MRFFAQPVDTSFNKLPTFSVCVLREGEEIAVYKCNILHDGSAAVFSPLVVTWGKGGNPGGGISRVIIDHCIFSAGGYCRDLMPEISEVIVTSGNLTEERAGLPFFQALDWTIIAEDEARADIKLHHVAQRIKAAAAPFINIEDTGAEDSGAEEAGNVSFALLRFAA